MIGLQLYTLRNFLKTPEDISVSLKRVKEIGYKGVEVFSGIGPIEPAELKKMINEAGLLSNSGHMNYGRIINETDKAIEECKIMGYETLVCPWLDLEVRNNEESYKKVAKELTKAGEKLLQNGISLAYHNHDFEFEKFNGRLGLDIIYSESDPGYLRTEFDTYWIQSGGGDPAEWILRFKDRTSVVHLKDMGAVGNKTHMMLPVGEGNLNWKRIFGALKEAGTKNYFVEQDNCNGIDPFECVTTSFNNLKKMGFE
ncbi:MAG: hypothetical protein A2452_09705 [Candidatus Firestonebacteria bacterium RIFOXYC2_FULL_39_67]|nr:MAG: hypothetical protein A2536_04065 [Candidatus Firestonebacteria bacterium RIFOXYD2_FULL_39_29]OGF51862.1 MAG: hypothetical protein A2497_00780 [Candidatus Firestonebacteria bacterium RifOxyC12_full_39_7]OGF54637.1 MAG: hypothetical protein A2452_09705 [Candidatus Firestonebacteria bacterium RIFOXYC2_FULL_39_67]